MRWQISAKRDERRQINEKEEREKKLASEVNKFNQEENDVPIKTFTTDQWRSKKGPQLNMERNREGVKRRKPVYRYTGIFGMVLQVLHVLEAFRYTDIFVYTAYS